MTVAVVSDEEVTFTKGHVEREGLLKIPSVQMISRKNKASSRPADKVEFTSSAGTAILEKYARSFPGFLLHFRLLFIENFLQLSALRCANQIIRYDSREVLRLLAVDLRFKAFLARGQDKRGRERGRGREKRMSGTVEHKSLAKTNEESQAPVHQKMSSTEEFLLSRESRTSKDRRQFTVVTVFDVCLTALLWVISTVSKGDDWKIVFFREVDISQPDFMKLSLFDVVITAVIRMCVLILSYSILLIGHWLPVAITTIATTIFLVLKALFFFSPAQGNLPQYTVLVSSFVVAWFQLWLVPFHILPRERGCVIHNTSSEVSERNAQTDEEFRSAMECSSDSDDDDNLSAILIAGKIYSKSRYVEEVEEAKLKAKGHLTEINTWKLLHSSNPEIRMSREKQVYFIRDTIACSPKSLFKIIWKDAKLWNRQITEFKVVLHIDPATELVYTTTAPILRGYISPRDFLDVRRMMLDTEKDVYEGVYVSVDSSIAPTNRNQKLVRGINGANYICIKRGSSDSKMSQIEWIQDSDIKSGIPRRLIEGSMCAFFQSYMESVKAFISSHPNEYP
ncbi:unnamed protein product [Litomosoides sigmodontis]|uniref:START domain-containing protein n=1 Tax=Litomosoides sigmodontis TaxID=42156 RepID=A0A3P6TV73_LITSI|nr:unnamed protein product [Litomosoides sigmodontis]